MSDVRIAPNIYRTPHGFRVYYREVDPATGRSKKVGRRFGPEVTLADLEAYRDGIELAAADPESRGFTADARRYLALTKITNMPSIKTRTIEIEKWIGIFGDTPRETITAPIVNEQLHQLHTSYAGGTVNKFRTALMSLWTELDGRSAANPIKDTDMFDEAEVTGRGQSYDLLTKILDAIPDERGIAFERSALYREIWAEPMTLVAQRYGVSASFLSRVCRRLEVPAPGRGYWAKPDRSPAPPLRRAGIERFIPEQLKSRARLEVLVWTGMDPSILGRMTMADVDLIRRQYTPPLRQKGMRRRKTPRPRIPLPMDLPETVAAFERAIAVGVIADEPRPFSTQSLSKTWGRACRRVERSVREATGNPRFRVPHIRLKDIRHSFGTLLFEKTGDLGTVGEMLQHAPGSSMTKRYALGAVPSVLRSQMQKVAAATPRRSIEKFGGRKAGGLVPPPEPARPKVVPIVRNS